MTSELLPLSDVVVPPRLRAANSPSVLTHIEDLRASLRRFGGHPRGLLQPILVDETNTLIAGWCRFSACRDEGWPSVPCYRRDKLSESENREIELEENFRRLGFTWQEEVAAVVDIHRLHMRKAAREGLEWTQQMTGDLLGGYSKSYVSNCMQIAPRLAEPAYLTCEGITDAVRVYLREREDAGVAELAKRTTLNRATAPSFKFEIEVLDKSCVACSGTGFNSKGGLCSPCVTTGRIRVLSTNAAILSPQVKSDSLLSDLMADDKVKEEVIDLSNTLFLGDSVRTILPLWPSDCVDHIFTDAPYGIDVANMQQASSALMDVSRVEATHDVGENLDLFAAMMPVFYRLLKEGGFFVTFCDEWNFRLLGDLALSAGFGVQRWSLHWEKTSPCKCQMAHVLTTKDHEVAIVCRKGAARLPSPVTTSRILCPNDADRASNPFAKPFSAWKYIYESFSIPGQTILEPFAGEGSGVTAGIRLNRRVLAVEKDEAHYNYLLEGVKSYWQGVFKKVRFV